MERLSEHFVRSEFACKCAQQGKNYCGGSAPINYELVDRLEDLRYILGGPLRITSGFRCLQHNRDIGSYPGSQHPKGNAADIAADGRDVDEMHRLAKPLFSFVKSYPWGIHVDVRRNHGEFR